MHCSRGGWGVQWWPRGALPASSRKDSGLLARQPPGGAQHVASPRGTSFIPPISQRRKLQFGMAQSARPKSHSWFWPSPDFESEAHGPCRPGLGGSQA